MGRWWWRGREGQGAGRERVLGGRDKASVGGMDREAYRGRGHGRAGEEEGRAGQDTAGRRGQDTAGREGRAGIGESSAGKRTEGEGRARAGQGRGAGQAGVVYSEEEGGRVGGRCEGNGRRCRQG